MARTKQTARKNTGAKAPRKQLANKAAKFLAEQNPHAVFVYFGQVDEIGHQDGFHPSVPSYLQALQAVDAHVAFVACVVCRACAVCVVRFVGDLLRVACIVCVCVACARV